MENFITQPSIYNFNLIPKKREMPASKTLAFLSVTGNESIAAVERKDVSCAVIDLGNLHCISVWNQVPNFTWGKSFSLSVGLLHVCEMVSQIYPVFLVCFGYLHWQPLSRKPGNGLLLAQHLAQLTIISCFYPFLQHKAIIMCLFQSCIKMVS